MGYAFVYIVLFIDNCLLTVSSYQFIQKTQILYVKTSNKIIYIVYLIVMIIKTTILCQETNANFNFNYNIESKIINLLAQHLSEKVFILVIFCLSVWICW